MSRTKRTPKNNVRTFASLASRARNIVENAGAIAMSRVNAVREIALDRAVVARSRTAKAVGKLENVFEQRVSQVVRKLGVPSNTDVRALARQVAELQANVERLRRSRSRARA